MNSKDRVVAKTGAATAVVVAGEGEGGITEERVGGMAEGVEVAMAEEEVEVVMVMAEEEVPLHEADLVDKHHHLSTTLMTTVCKQIVLDKSSLCRVACSDS
jgi:hypothetical protein